MRVLLANMPIKFNKKENLEPPLGISYVGAVLKESGHEVFLKDFEVENFTESGAVSFIKDNKIQVLGLSFRTASYGSAKIFSNAIKDIRKDLFFIVGGHHATAFSKGTIQDLLCDAVVRGEGEYATKNLLDALMNCSDLSGVRGISYSFNGQIIDNPASEPIKELDKLPFPLREFLPYDMYTLATIITSRGCPFNCIYCDKGVSTRKVQYRSPEKILKEIEYITQKFKKHRLYIVDDHFFLKKDRTHAILDGIIAGNFNIKWVCQARADGVDKEILLKAKKSGCEQIIFGLETGDKMELAYIKKQSTLDQARKVVMLTKKAGIKARTNFMLGFPISTHESTRNTIRFAREIEPDIVRFFVVTPLPNTDLWDNIYGKNSPCSNIDWASFDFYNPNFEIKELTHRDMLLYVLAGYWHVLKKGFILETTIFLFPNIIRLIFKSVRTKRFRGNVSQYFPAFINLIRDTIPPLLKKGPIAALNLIFSALRLESRI